MKLIQLFIALGIVALDRFTKLWASGVLMQQKNGTIPLIEGVFHFTYTQNTGAAFGIFQGAAGIFSVVSFAATIVLIYILFFYKAKPIETMSRIALTFIMGGAAGNLIDRALFGYVVDFMDFRLINFAIFNVADAFLVIGVILIIITQILIVKKDDAPEGAHGIVPENVLETAAGTPTEIVPGAASETAHKADTEHIARSSPEAHAADD